MASDQSMPIEVSPEIYSKLLELSKERQIGVTSIVEEAVQVFLNNQESRSGTKPEALKRPQATYKPQTHLRQIPVVPTEAAVLFIDVQNYNCHRQGAEVQALPQVKELTPDD